MSPLRAPIPTNPHRAIPAREGTVLRERIRLRPRTKLCQGWCVPPRSVPRRLFVATAMQPQQPAEARLRQGYDGRLTGHSPDQAIASAELPSGTVRSRRWPISSVRTSRGGLVMRLNWIQLRAARYPLRWLVRNPRCSRARPTSALRTVWGRTTVTIMGDDGPSSAFRMKPAVRNSALNHAAREPSPHRPAGRRSISATAKSSAETRLDEWVKGTPSDEAQNPRSR